MVLEVVLRCEVYARVGSREGTLSHIHAGTALTICASDGGLSASTRPTHCPWLCCKHKRTSTRALSKTVHTSPSGAQRMVAPHLQLLQSQCILQHQRHQLIVANIPASTAVLLACVWERQRCGKCAPRTLRSVCASPTAADSLAVHSFAAC